MPPGTIVDSSLEEALRRRAGALRPPDLVMSPAVLGAARLTRYSFSRSMLRRAARDGWYVERLTFDLDADGRGEAFYRIEAEGHVFHFVVFTTTLDESKHTDRVIAEAWEITAALVEGELDADFLHLLRTQVPLQEDGRLDSRVLVLTRGNRSVRFFEYVIERLVLGLQPEPERVADSGYLMRSTAFYGNGKYGMRSFLGYPTDHPLAAPYRAQFLCAWLFRELSLDSAEHCAALRAGPSVAARLDADWRRYFGLGNATGLGLVPYAFKHPRVIHAWAAVREIALANVRALPESAVRVALLRRWLQRAADHFAVGTDADCTPFLSPAEMTPLVQAIRERFDGLAGEPGAAGLIFDRLYRWAERQDADTAELVVAMLVELDETDDRLIDQYLRVVEYGDLDPAMSCAELLTLIAARFSWLDGLEFGPSAEHCWWVISDNAEEPRRAVRQDLQSGLHDVAIDVAVRVERLRQGLATATASGADVPVGVFLATHPEHLQAVERVMVSDGDYGEPRDNACSADYLPLQLQRFQLAMYGMDNFKPKSTDWLRVTLFQGAPRVDDLASGFTDDWVLPPRPAPGTATGRTR